MSDPGQLPPSTPSVPAWDCEGLKSPRRPRTGAGKGEVLVSLADASSAPTGELVERSSHWDRAYWTG